MNDRATIEGAEFPGGKAALGELRKIVPVRAATNPSFTVGKGFVLRDTAAKDKQSGSDIALKVTNASRDVQCNVNITLSAKDAKEAQVGTTQMAEVQASMGGPKDGKNTMPSKTLGTIMQHSCLGAGEDGWFLISIEDAAYASVTKVDVSLTSVAGAAIAPAGRFTPTAYSWSSSMVAVTMTNTGTTPATLESGMFLLLDGAGDPLAFGTLTTDTSGTPAPTTPGKTASVSAIVPYEGAGGKRVLAWAYYKD